MQPDATSPAALSAISADQLAERVFAWRRGFNAMHLIDLGLELGLFDAIAKAPGCTAEDLARERGLHPPYVAAWCTAALSLGLVDADDTPAGKAPGPGQSAGLRWPLRLAPHVIEVLGQPGHPRYLGGYVQLGARHAADDFAAARQCMRDGSTRPFQGRDASFSAVVSQSLAGVNRLVARKILPGLDEIAAALTRGGSLLDVGCGQADLLRQIAQVFPAARLCGVDTDPTGLGAARALVEAEGLSGRIELIQGDLAQRIAPDSQDVATLIEVLHEIEPPQRPALLRALAGVLRPGGSLVIVDETHPTTPRQAREDAYLFPVQTALEEMLWGNIVPTAEEQEWLLEQAGFEPASQRKLLGAGFTLLVSRKKA